VVSGFGSKKPASTSLPLCAVADDDRLPLVVAALVAIVAVVVVVVVAVVAVAVVLRLAVANITHNPSCWRMRLDFARSMVVVGSDYYHSSSSSSPAGPLHYQ
jgi:hypothetical protein